MYVFIRKDLELEQKVVQATHAGIESTRRFKQEDHPRLVVIDLKNENKLKKIMAEMKSKGIEIVEFVEEDGSITSFATRPIRHEERKIFGRFSLFKEK